MSSVELILNDLSFRTPAIDRRNAAVNMGELVRAMAQLVRDEFARGTLRSAVPLQEVMLADGYSVFDWAVDRSISRDLKQFFLTMATKVPLDAGLTGDAIGAFLLNDFVLAEPPQDPTPALGLAFLLQGIALSLPTEDRWRRAEIRLIRQHFDEAENWVEASAVVDNVADERTRDEVSERRRRAIQSGIDSTDEMWTAHSICFPHLEFCPAVRRQISQLPSGVLSLVVGTLAAIDVAARTWRLEQTVHPDYGFEVHSESESTMEQYGGDRSFTRLNGQEETFKLHAVVGQRYRIHFLPNHDSREIVIGYIGDHLPTVRHH